MKSIPNIFTRSAFFASLALALATSPQAFAVTWDGSDDMTWSQPDSTSWGVDTYNSGDTANFASVGAGTVTVDAGGVTPGSINVNSTTPADYTFSGGAIGGTGTIFTKFGTSILTLSGANTFTGDFGFEGLTGALNTGVVRVGANGVGTAGAITSSPFGTGTVNMYTLVSPLPNTITVAISSDSTAPRTILNKFKNSMGNKRVVMTLGDATNNGKLTFAGDWSVSGGGNNYMLWVNSDVQLDGIMPCGNNNYFGKQGPATLILTNPGNTPPSSNAKNTVFDGTLLVTRAAALPIPVLAANDIIINGANAVLAVRMGDGAASGWSTEQVDTLLSRSVKTSGALGIDTTNADLTQWAAFTTTNFGAALGLTKLGSHTLTLNQANTYVGATRVSAGTLALVGGSQSSAITVNDGAALGFTLGSPTTSSKQVTLNAGHAIAITGTVDNSSDYPLMTASGFTGTPTLAASIENYILETRSDNTELWLAYSGSASSPYDVWANGIFANGTLADKSADADGDGDGLTNFEEYAYGLDPTSGSSVNPISQAFNPATGVFKYTRQATPATTGLTYTYEWSSTLGNDWVEFTPDSANSNSSTPVEEITVAVPNALLSNSKLFMRVKVAQ